MAHAEPTDPIRPNLYELHLARARREKGLPERTGPGMNLGIVSRVINFDWDPSEHPRDILGQFRKATNSLKDNDTLVGSDGTSIKREGPHRFKVHTTNRWMDDTVAATPKEAADYAIQASARNGVAGKSVGGAKNASPQLVDAGQFKRDDVAVLNGFGLVRVDGPAAGHKVQIRKNIVAKGGGTEEVTEVVEPALLDPYKGVPPEGTSGSLPPASNAEEKAYATAVEELAQDVENGYGEGMGQAIRTPSGTNGMVGMRDLNTFELEDLRDYLQDSDNDAAPATLQTVEDELSTRNTGNAESGPQSIYEEMDQGVIYSTNDLLRELAATDNTESRRDEAYDLLIEGEYDGPDNLDELRGRQAPSAMSDDQLTSTIQVLETKGDQSEWRAELEDEAYNIRELPRNETVATAPIYTPKGVRIDANKQDRELMAGAIRSMVPDAEAAQRGEFDVVGATPKELEDLAYKLENVTALTPLGLNISDMNLLITGLTRGGPAARALSRKLRGE